MSITNVSNTVQVPQSAIVSNERLINNGAAAGAAQENSSATKNQTTDTSPTTTPTKPLEQIQLQGVVDSINKALKQADRNLEFSIDEDTKKSVVKLVDSETGDVIREFPSKEALAISRAIGQMQQQGLLLKQKA